MNSASALSSALSRASRRRRAHPLSSPAAGEVGLHAFGQSIRRRGAGRTPRRSATSSTTRLWAARSGWARAASSKRGHRSRSLAAEDERAGAWPGGARQVSRSRKTGTLMVVASQPSPRIATPAFGSRSRGLLRRDARHARVRARTRRAVTSPIASPRSSSAPNAFRGFSSREIRSSTPSRLRGPSSTSAGSARDVAAHSRRTRHSSPR